MLEKFHERIRQPLKENGAINIVCIGDSVTHGCFESSEDMHSSFDVFESYTVKLHKALHTLFPDKVFNVINSGIGGETATVALGRFDRDVLAHHPDLVIIAFGVNDFRDENAYLSSIGKMFDILNEKGISCIYMTEHMMNTYSANDTSPCHKAYSETTAKVQTDGTMDSLFSKGMALAKEKNIAICNVYGKWKKLYEYGANVTKLLANRINHPSREMHGLFVSSLISTMFFEN